MARCSDALRADVVGPLAHGALVLDDGAIEVLDALGVAPGAHRALARRSRRPGVPRAQATRGREREAARGHVNCLEQPRLREES